MKLSINDNKIYWQHDSNSICVEVPSINGAIYAPESKVVAVLSSPKTNSCIISIFEMNGLQRISVQEPKGMTFNCLGDNRGKDVAVMVKVYKSGWCDWWYAVDPINGKLSSLGEGR